MLQDDHVLVKRTSYQKSVRVGESCSQQYTCDNLSFCMMDESRPEDHHVLVSHKQTTRTGLNLAATVAEGKDPLKTNCSSDSEWQQIKHLYHAGQHGSDYQAQPAEELPTCRVVEQFVRPSVIQGWLLPSVYNGNLSGEMGMFSHLNDKGRNLQPTSITTTASAASSNGAACHASIQAKGGFKFESTLLKDIGGNASTLRQAGLQKGGLEASGHNSHMLDLLELLVSLAEKEEWTLVSKGSSCGIYLDCLQYYLEQQFEHAVDEGKVVQCIDSRGFAMWTTFCTGLATAGTEESIYAIFTRMDDMAGAENSEHLPWLLYDFVPLGQLLDPSQPWNRFDSITAPPEAAKFFADPVDLLYTGPLSVDSLLLKPQLWDSLDDHLDWFPSILVEQGVSPQARKQAAMAAVQRSLQSLARNPMAAVPSFNKTASSIQLLLPLKLDPDSGAAHLALAVEAAKSRRGTCMYRATGVLPLDDAYKQARTLMPVHQPWLTAAVRQSSRREEGRSSCVAEEEVRAGMGSLSLPAHSEPEGLKPPQETRNVLQPVDEASVGPPPAEESSDTSASPRALHRPGIGGAEEGRQGGLQGRKSGAGEGQPRLQLAQELAKLHHSSSLPARLQVQLRQQLNRFESLPTLTWNEQHEDPEMAHKNTYKLLRPESAQQYYAETLGGHLWGTHSALSGHGTAPALTNHAASKDPNSAPPGLSQLSTVPLGGSSRVGPAFMGAQGVPYEDSAALWGMRRELMMGSDFGDDLLASDFEAQSGSPAAARSPEDEYVEFTPADDLCPKLNISQLPPRFVLDFLIGSRALGELAAEQHVERCFSRFGVVAQCLVQKNKNHLNKWFSIIEFVYWKDDYIRQRVVAGEPICLTNFYAGEEVIVRRHRDKQKVVNRNLSSGGANVTSTGAPCRLDWKYTGSDTKAGKPLYKGPCTSCGRESTVPFKPVINGQPPRCRNCLPLFQAGLLPSGNQPANLILSNSLPPSMASGGLFPGYKYMSGTISIDAGKSIGRSQYVHP